MKLLCPACRCNTHLQPSRPQTTSHFSGRCEHCGAYLTATVRYEEPGKEILVQTRVMGKEVMPYGSKDRV